MKKIFSWFKSMPKRTTALVAIAAATLIIPAVTFAWGPARDTYTIASPAPKVVFNSITDNPLIGDERNFVTVKDASNTADGGWADNITVQPGKEYVVRVYVHNDAATNLNLKAVNTRVSASVPTTTGTTESISGFVSADNATTVWDDIHFNSTQNFNLAYVAGSSQIFNNGYATTGQPLTDSIVTSAGTLIGYNGPDGVVPGCFQYANYVYFKVKPQFAATNTFTTNKLVRKSGDTTWVKSVTTNPGDTVDYEVAYKNTGETLQSNVVIKDTLPKGVTYIPGSTYLLNGNYVTPHNVNDDVVSTSGINIGTYSGGGAGYIKFSAKVDSNDALTTCGTNTLVNTERTTVSGGYIDSTATVVTNKTCTTPTPTYTCNALTASLVSGTEYSFKPSATATNGATIVNYIYNFGDGTTKTVTNATAVTHTYPTKSASYTASLSVTFLVNGVQKVVTGYGCNATITIKETPATPVYACTVLTSKLISGNEYSFQGTGTATNGATIVNYIYNFGDGSSKTVTDASAVTHTYATKGATYSASLSLTVNVNGVNKVVTSSACTVTITVSQTPECKPGIPVGDARCVTTPITPTTPTAPTELPHTGTGFNIVTFLGLGSLIASIAYYVTSRRALLGR